MVYASPNQIWWHEHCNACVAACPFQAVEEKNMIEEFIKNGRSLFGRQAASVEDIGLAGQEARQMVDGLHEIQQVR